MVERGELKLDEPIAKYLPGVGVPNHGGKQITLEHLATHTSGLPRDATNLDLNQLNPFATYGPVQLFEFLSGLQLTRDPGGQFEYSNVGVSLLGYILTQRTGMAYEDLLRVRILEPLGMKNTTITLSKEQLSQVTGQPMFELFPEQETEFFVKAVNAQISFLKDHTGAATGLVLHQNRANQRARKIR
jgi:CubicO group peptidase (beta-lactamase class C family)